MGSARVLPINCQLGVYLLAASGKIFFPALLEFLRVLDPCAVLVPLYNRHVCFVGIVVIDSTSSMLMPLPNMPPMSQPSGIADNAWRAILSVCSISTDEVRNNTSPGSGVFLESNSYSTSVVKSYHFVTWND